MSTAFEMSIKERIQLLKSIDTEECADNADYHQYRLADPLPLDQCLAIEKDYGIVLPEDYRDFITQIGNGGVGPGMGLERFAIASSKDHLPWPAFSRSERTKIKSFFGKEHLGPEQRYDAEGNVIDPWEFRFYLLARDYASDGKAGRDCLHRPFPLDKPFRVIPDEAWRRGWQNWTDADQEDFARRKEFFQTIPRNDGAIEVCSFDDYNSFYLVLNGPFRGHIWIHDAVEGDFVPASMRRDRLEADVEEPPKPFSVSAITERLFERTRLPPPADSFTFTQWYEHWLDKALESIHSEYTPQEIENRRKSDEMFEELKNLPPRLIESGEVDGLKYSLYEPE
ncbi:MAG: hypothetical protein JWP89_4990 [Schlesneria sp.]|nr:hypothetical protein [Schlesneria sp.]